GGVGVGGGGWEGGGGGGRVWQVERGVLVDVDLDALQDRDARQLLVCLVDQAPLSGQPLRAKAVDHGDAGRVVGYSQVFVTAGLRCSGHVDDGGTSVRPVRVGVQVAAVAHLYQGGDLERRRVGVLGLVQVDAKPLEV